MWLEINERDKELFASLRWAARLFLWKSKRGWWWLKIHFFFFTMYCKRQWRSPEGRDRTQESPHTVTGKLTVTFFFLLFFFFPDARRRLTDHKENGGAWIRASLLLCKRTKAAKGNLERKLILTPSSATVSAAPWGKTQRPAFFQGSSLEGYTLSMILWCHRNSSGWRVKGLKV